MIRSWHKKFGLLLILCAIVIYIDHSLIVEHCKVIKAGGPRENPTLGFFLILSFAICGVTIGYWISKVDWKAVDRGLRKNFITNWFNRDGI